MSSAPIFISDTDSDEAIASRCLFVVVVVGRIRDGVQPHNVQIQDL